MKMKISNDLDKDLFTSLFVDTDYTLRAVKVIVRLANIPDYLQILYTYGIECLTILLLHYENYSEYEECHKIKTVVDNYNKSTGSQLKLK